MITWNSRCVTNIDCISVIFLLIFVRQIYSEDVRVDEIYSLADEASFRAYMSGVDMGIINTEKYPFEAFQRDERRVFRDLYSEYNAINGTLPLNYEEWLIMNNYGILPDTQESLFKGRISKRSTADNKRRFVNTVKKGDILITGRGIGGLVGHSAIMTTDNWVLEMKGGPGWERGISSNNRQIDKHVWFDEHKSDWTTVYRCPDGNVARDAANWADYNYYNPKGGAKKLIHVTYRLTTDMKSKNPSYCSKLVIQAYYFGTGRRQVISNSIAGRIIVPTSIPTFFLSPYRLVSKGRF